MVSMIIGQIPFIILSSNSKKSPTRSDALDIHRKNVVQNNVSACMELILPNLPFKRVSGAKWYTQRNVSFYSFILKKKKLYNEPGVIIISMRATIAQNNICVRL